jgi:methylmalonyl-CoA mutase
MESIKNTASGISSMTFEAWKELVEKESSIPPFRTWENSEIPRFFTSENPINSGLMSYDNRVGVGDSESGRIRSWDNVASINEAKENNANSHALNALMLGADGILFRNASEFNTDVLLADIMPEYISLQFWDCDVAFSARVKKWMDSHDVDHTKIRGYFNLPNPSLEDYSRMFTLWKDYENMRFVHLHLKESSSLTDQLTDYLVTLVALLDLLTDQGISIKSIWQRTSVAIECGPLFFEEIARIRALRLLTYKIFRAYEMQEVRPEELLIHAVSPSWIHEDYQPHGNMLKSCTTGMAAILGGCTSLTLMPEDQESVLQNRMARNVSLILREECHLDKVTDPVAGSYYITMLTHTLAKNAWEKFKETKE